MGTGELADTALPIRSVELCQPATAIIEKQAIGSTGVGHTAGSAGNINDLRPACGVVVTGELGDVALPIGAVELRQPATAIVEEQGCVSRSGYERARDDVSPACRIGVVGELANVALSIHVVELGYSAIFIIEEQGRVIL